MEFYIEKRLINLYFKKLLYVSIYNHILLNCTYRIDIDSEADMFNEIEAYMVKLAETDCEIKILYKKHFNIDPNTSSPFNIYPEEEQIERYSEKEQIERYSQNEAFWAKLKEEYDDIDELTQMRNPRAQYINKKYINIRMLAYIKLKHNQKAIKQIQKIVAEIPSSTTPKTINAECPICLKKIHKNEQKTLECKHTFRTQCIFKWALKNDSKTAFKTPVKNRHIHLFKKDSNIFTCPCCRIEYTHDVRTSEIKRVFATIHLKDKDDDVVHYITDPMETIVFVPLSELDADDCVNEKWATILSLLKYAWERGDTNIYALKRLQPDPEFVLTNDRLKIPPLDRITGMPINKDKKQLLIFRHVEVEELEALLNNC